MNRNLFALVLLSILPAFGIGQSLASIEDSVLHYYTRLESARSDESRRAASDAMKNWLKQGLNQPEVMRYPFQRLRFGKITSSDGWVRIFNWNEPNEDGTYVYHGFVVWRTGKDSIPRWVELKDQVREPEGLQNKYMTSDKWLGALYYEIIPSGKGKKGRPADAYILLGWDGKDELTTRKIIDVLTFQGEKIRFGAPLFETPEGTQKRYILEYSNEVSSSLKYFPGKECIVMDHLSPKTPMLKGLYAEYGPDGTYDLFQWHKGKWLLKENIDISQFAADDIRPYVDPRPRR